MHYFGCTNFNKDNDGWDEKLSDIAVNFHEGLPTEGFFNQIESRSLVIIDDLYEVSSKRPVKYTCLKFLFRRQSIMTRSQELFESIGDIMVSVYV